MSYNNVVEIINERLDDIEKKENVKIIHAIESGSRAWGFASPDSDYDVRFIYLRTKEHYLKLEETKDFIEWELNETFDINGWDIKKTLQHFHKSNATLFEWSSSPVIYRTTKEWDKIKNISEKYFSCRTSMYHYYGTANKNYNEYLLDDMVKYKKYFYVLRPLFACRWIDERKCPPPVRFSELMEIITDSEIRTAVDNLLEAKKIMTEAQKGKRIDYLNEYIKTNLDLYKEKAASMEDGRREDWNELNRVFIELLQP